jgi:SAM-dependent methyltransferase
MSTNVPVYEQGPDFMDAEVDNILASSDGFGHALTQGMIFTAAALNMPEVAAVVERAGTIHVWGTGFGADAATLKTAYPGNRVVGWDFSPRLVEEARIVWSPVVEFRVGDVRKDVEQTDVIWCSHTLEHVPGADVALRTMLEKAKAVVVLVPPIAGDERDATHVGAEPPLEWLGRVRSPKYAALMETVRPVTNSILGCEVMGEQSLVMVWDGDEA